MKKWYEIEHTHDVIYSQLQRCRGMCIKS